MTITNGYATLAEFKLELGISDTTDDAKLELAVEAASRWLDEMTGWRFFTTTNDESRYYTAVHTDRLDVPEGVISLTTLACDQDGNRVYEETWGATDYDLVPYNAALKSEPEPYTSIETTPQGLYGFSQYRRGVKLTGKFGYSSAAPKAIKRACVLKAQQLFMRKDMPFGIMATSATGTVTMKVPEDADILSMLTRYRRSVN